MASTFYSIYYRRSIISHIPCLHHYFIIDLKASTFALLENSCNMCTDVWAEVVLSIYRLVLGWIIQGSNHSRGKRISLLPNNKTISGAHPASYLMHAGVLSGLYSGWYVMTTHPHPELRLRMSGTILLLPTYTFLA